MKKMGRTHRPFFRICAIDKRSQRDGRVLEQLGTYDPQIADTDARVTLNNERIDYWLSVGAQPSDRVGTLIKKYGTNGTHADAHAAAREKLAGPRAVPEAGEPVTVERDRKAAEEAKKAEEAKAAQEAKAAEEAAKAEAEAPAEEATAEGAEEAAAEAPAEEAAAEETTEEAPAEEEKPAE